MFAQATKKKKKSVRPKSPACRVGCKPETTTPTLDASTPEDAALQKDLAPLARDLRHGVPGAYDRLAAFANKNASSVWGKRAALALGYDDFSKARCAQALVWLQKADGDALLKEYTFFWTAQSERALQKNAQAAQDFTTLLKDFPNTALREQILEAYVPTTISLGRPLEGLEALGAYPPASAKPSLLLVRARANEAARKLVLAAKDYQTLYYKFPLSDESKDAAIALPRLNKDLHSEFPYATAELQDQRAQDFFDAHKWKEARLEYEKLASMLKDPANPTRQRALVRAAECRQHPKPSSALFTKLTVSDPEADAERLFYLSQAYRSQKNEIAMLTAIENVAEKYPKSHWTDEALMAAGNYYWVQLERPKAIGYYQRILDSFPAGKNAYTPNGASPGSLIWSINPTPAIRSPFSSASIPSRAALTTLSTGWAATPSAAAILPTRAPSIAKPPSVSPLPILDSTLPCASKRLAQVKKISLMSSRKFPQRLRCVPSTSPFPPALPIAGIAPRLFVRLASTLPPNSNSKPPSPPPILRDFWSKPRKPLSIRAISPRA